MRQDQEERQSGGVLLERIRDFWSTQEQKHRQDSVSEGRDVHNEEAHAVNRDAVLCKQRHCREPVLLPVICEFCGLKFCSEHGRYDLHECVACKDENGVVRDPMDVRAASCSDCGKRIKPEMVKGGDDLDMLLAVSRSIQDEIRATVARRVHGSATISGRSGTAFALATAATETDMADELRPLQRQRKQATDALNAHLLKLHRQGDGCKVADARLGHSGNSVNSAAKKKCGMKRCKEKGMFVFCKGCGKKFCLKHRLPEVHACS